MVNPSAKGKNSPWRFANPWPVSPSTRHYRYRQRSHRPYRTEQKSRHHKPHNVESIEYEIPDGGYGWVVVFSAFVFISLPMGISASFSLYRMEWLNVFQAGEVKTSLIGALGSGCIPLLGSLGGMILTNLLDDIRLVGITGCVLSSLGFILSVFMEGTNALAFTYGVLGGFGLGLMFNCAYLSVGYYFDKRRPFATAIASSGTGFGTVISLMIRKAIATYGWRGSLYTVAAICIQAVVCGMLIRPLYAKKAKKPTMAPLEEVITKEAPEQTSADTNDNTKENGRVFSSHDAVFRRRDSGFHMPGFMSQTHIVRRPKKHHSPDTAITPHSGDVKLNPYLREDIFFSGSTYDLENMQQKGKAANSFASRQKITHHDDYTQSQLTIEDVEVDMTGFCRIKQNLKKNFNLSIFKEPTFFLVALAMTLHHMAFFIPYYYVVSLTDHHRIPREKADYLTICFGMSNFVFKLVIGRMMTLFEVEQLYVVMVTLLLGCTASILCTFCTEFYQFVLASIMYGGTSPIVTIYLTNILVKYLGISNLTNAFSIVTMVRGLGSLSGPPIAGFVIEKTGLKRAAFYVGSMADLLSALCFGVILFINRDKSKEKDIETESGKSPKEPTEPVKDSNYLSPKVIVTVPTAEGKLDKMIHYSNERFDRLTAQDQREHAKVMRDRVRRNSTEML